MSNKTYDILKDISLYVLPAILVLFIALADIWGIPYATQIQLTIAAIDTFIGAMVKWLNVKWNKQDSDIE